MIQYQNANLCAKFNYQWRHFWEILLWRKDFNNLINFNKFDVNNSKLIFGKILVNGISHAKFDFHDLRLMKIHLVHAFCMSPKK